MGHGEESQSGSRDLREGTDGGAKSGNSRRAAWACRCQDEEGREQAGRDTIVLTHPRSWDFLLQPWEMS